MFRKYHAQQKPEGLKRIQAGDGAKRNPCLSVQRPKRNPEGVTESITECISFIILYSIPLKEQLIFLIKRPFLVVLCLPQDILHCFL